MDLISFFPTPLGKSKRRLWDICGGHRTIIVIPLGRTHKSTLSYTRVPNQSTRTNVPIILNEYRLLDYLFGAIYKRYFIWPY